MSFDQFDNKITQRAVLEASNADPVFDFEIEFDVSEQEIHKSTAKVTDHPVETGAQISDHHVDEPDTLDLVLWVSNTPITPQTSIATVNPQRAEEAYQELLIIKRAGAFCTVTTTLREYTDMLITELTVTRNKDTGGVLSLSLKLKQVVTATSEVVEAPTPKVLRGQSVKDQGKKPTDTAPAAVTAKSKTLLLELGQAGSSDLALVTGG